jgi:hypothetical protein
VLVVIFYFLYLLFKLVSKGLLLELSKQAIEDHVSIAFTVYSVNEGARLTIDIHFY